MFSGVGKTKDVLHNAINEMDSFSVKWQRGQGKDIEGVRDCIE